MCGGIDVSTHSQLRYQKCLDAHGALRGRITNSSSTAQTPTGRSLESLSATLKSVFGSITLGSKKTNKSSGDSWICFPSGRRTFLLLLFESFSFLMKTMRKILKKIGFVMMVKRRDILISFLKRRRMDLKFPLFKETRYIPPPIRPFARRHTIPGIVFSSNHLSAWCRSLDVPSFLYFDFSDQS